MKFVLMYDFLTEVGGLEKLMATHAKFLKEEGHEVRLFFGKIKPEMLEHFEGLQVEAYGNSVLGAVLGFNRLKEMIKPDEIIISYSFPVNYVTRKFKNRKMQYINHFPNFLYLPFRERLIWANNSLRKTAVIASILFGKLLRRIDKELVFKNEIIFYNSYFTKNRLKTIYPNGIVSYPPVSEDFIPLQSTRYMDKFIFTSGRIIPDKRIDWLLEAFSRLEDKSIKLLIAGQGKKKYIKELKEITKDLKISNRVKFLGVIPKEDLIILNSMAEVYVFPAPKEDFGLTPAEAISCGTPVITWKDGSGPTEQIIDGVNGYLAKPYSTLDFADKINKSLNAKWDRERIIQSAKKFSAEEVKGGFIKAVNDKLK